MNWTIGFEIEWLAPRGMTRADFVLAWQQKFGGEIRKFWFLQSEPSPIPGSRPIEHLTPGFDVWDDGKRQVRVVDDLTLQADLVKETRPIADWYKIMSDDGRWLRLIARHAQIGDLQAILGPTAALLGTELANGPDRMVKLLDDSGTSIAIGAPLSGERERPCEVISPPLSKGRESWLAACYHIADELGFIAPAEGAIHVHFDASAFMSGRALFRLCSVLASLREEIREILGTNPRCRRLGPWSVELQAVLCDPHLANLPWFDVERRLRAAKPSKFVDVNLSNLIYRAKDKFTIEWRILPVFPEPESVLMATAWFEALLHWAVSEEKPVGNFSEWVDYLVEDRSQRAWWSKQLSQSTGYLS